MAHPFAQIYAECYKDKSRIKFIEKFLSTYDADAGIRHQFLLFPRQKAFLNALSTHNEVIAIKHRQAGITTVSSAWITGQCVFASPESPETILCIAARKPLAEEIIVKITDFLDQVPRWFWGSDYYDPDPKNPKNLKSIYVKKNRGEFELFNGCHAYARSSNPDAARGISAVSVLLCDEAAFFDDTMAYQAARMAQSSVRGYRTIMVSTPNGKDQLYYKSYSQALSHENNYFPVEFKWFQDIRYNRFLKWTKKNEETGAEETIVEPVKDKLGNIEYNEEKWRKLESDGWKPTSPWYVKACKGALNDKQKIAQEIEVSFLGSADNVVPQETIEMQRSQNVIQIDDTWELRDPLVPETWIWEDPQPGHRYILSIDPSSGSSDDNTSLQVIDCDAIDENGTPYFNQVLEYSGKRLGDEIAVIADKYGRIYNNALIVVECIGGYGDAVVIPLMAMKYPNLYYDETGLRNYTVNDPLKRYDNDDTGKLPGFRTNAVRAQMLDNFRAELYYNNLRIRSLRVINELDTWVWKNGRPDHMKGFHDDSLTCLAMGLFVMKFYMFKKLRDAEKDRKILHSWKSSNSIKGRDDDRYKLKEEVDLTAKKRLPIYSSYQKQRRDEQKFRALVMLGGFKPKKK
jgi:hypothetical protein